MELFDFILGKITRITKIAQPPQNTTKVFSMSKTIFALYFFAFILTGCANKPVNLFEAGQSKSKIDFIDISSFDRDLSTSLSDKHNSVEVAFYEKVSPNHVPDRLQKWLSSVEKTGGKVEVRRPEGEFASKDPFALLSLAGTLFSTLKTLATKPFEQDYETAKGRNAIIQLERNKSGEAVISKIMFVKPEK